MSWCGYIDMLGTRSMAGRSAGELTGSLFNFHSALQAHFPIFRDADCVAFSDGAFFRTSEFENFRDYYIKVRNQLFQAGLFFRCAYVEGDIEITERDVGGGDGDLPREPPRFRSFTFAGQAPVAYQKESEFKGVGCYIELLPTSAKLPDGIIESFFIRLEGARLRAERFFDFAFSAYEISDPKSEQITKEYVGQQRLLDEIFYSCHAALSQSDQVGSYFLPLFISAIKSESFAKITIVDHKWQNAPYIFLKLFTGQTLKAIKDLPGLNLILLSAFDHLYSGCDGAIPGEVEQRVLRKMLTRPSCFRNLDRVPTFVISPKARRRLIEIKAESEDVAVAR